MTDAVRPRTIPADDLITVIGNVQITAMQTPQAGCLVQVRIDGRIARDLCTGHNHQTGAIAAYCALVERFQAEATDDPDAGNSEPAPAPQPALAAEGDQIGHHAGNAVITVQRTRFTWTVAALVVVERIDDWSRAYATEAEAGAAANRVARAFATWGTDTAIAARRGQLAAQVRDHLDPRRGARQRLRLAESVLASLATLADRAARPQRSPPETRAPRTLPSADVAVQSCPQESYATTLVGHDRLAFDRHRHSGRRGNPRNHPEPGGG